MFSTLTRPGPWYTTTRLPVISLTFSLCTQENYEPRRPRRNWPDGQAPTCPGGQVSEDAELRGGVDDLRAVVDRQLAHDAAHVELHRAVADQGGAADLPVRQAAREQADDLQLPRRQPGVAVLIGQ